MIGWGPCHGGISGSPWCLCPGLVCRESAVTGRVSSALLLLAGDGHLIDCFVTETDGLFKWSCVPYIELSLLSLLTRSGDSTLALVASLASLRSLAPGLHLPPREVCDLILHLLLPLPPCLWILLSDKCKVYKFMSCSEARVTFSLVRTIDPYDLDLVRGISVWHARRLLFASCSEARVTFKPVS